MEEIKEEKPKRKYTKRAKTPVVDFRPEMDYNKRINFDLIEHNPDNAAKYKFRCTNDEKGELQQMLQRGWKLWTLSEDDRNESFMFNEDATAPAANRSGETYARVVVGQAATGQPLYCYLMYTTHKHYNKMLTHFDGIAKEQLNAAGANAKSNAAQTLEGMGGSGVKGYDVGNGVDGLSLSTSVVNQIDQT